MVTPKHPWTKHAGADGKETKQEDFFRTGYGQGSRDDAHPPSDPRFANARQQPHDGVSGDSAAGSGQHPGEDRGGFGHSPHHRSDSKHQTRH